MCKGFRLEYRASHLANPDEPYDSILLVDESSERIACQRQVHVYEIYDFLDCSRLRGDCDLWLDMGRYDLGQVSKWGELLAVRRECQIDFINTKLMASRVSHFLTIQLAFCKSLVGFLETIEKAELNARRKR